jgi:hemolysin III
MRRLVTDRSKSLGEEIADATSHGISFVLAVALVPFLVARATEQGSAASIVGVGVFSATMIVLYLLSTLDHALPRRPAA